jgi:Tfp pilus assembly protein PilF
MNNKFNYVFLFSIMSVGLTACNDVAKKESPPPSMTEAEKIQQAGDVAVTKGISQFEAGAYVDAEAILLSSAVWDANDITKVKALKYLAFTYCVTERPMSCKQAFERALQLDPSFDLATAESSHPLWGPQFKIVKTTDQKTP